MKSADSEPTVANAVSVNLEASNSRVLDNLSTPFVVRVIPDIAGLDKVLDYLVPPRLVPDIRVGTRVRIPVHGRKTAGWVVETNVVPPEGVSLLEISKVSGWGPPPRIFELARWAAWRWAGPITFFLRSASPEVNVWTLPALEKRQTSRRVSGSGSGSAFGSGSDGLLASGDLNQSTSYSNDNLEIQSLLDKAFDFEGHVSLIRLAPMIDPFKLVLGAISKMLEMPAVDSTDTNPSSVYSDSDTAIDTNTDDTTSRTVLVLVPNIGWSTRLSSRLIREGLSVAKSWAEARAGWPVVVGCRAAAWSPLPRLAGVVVLDAHDESYREESSPTYSAVDVAVERARLDQVSCLVVSGCPTVVQSINFNLVQSSKEFERTGWPRLCTVDRRAADPRTGLLSHELIQLGRDLLEANHSESDFPQLVCILNRTGRSKLLACSACGELVRCERCGSYLELVDDLLRCKNCLLERPMVCAECGSIRLKMLRPGISRIREELEALLGVQVEEISGPQAGQSASNDAKAPLAQVVIGTEAVLSRVRRAHGVAFLDFDQHLLAPRLGAGEQALALLAKASRLLVPRRKDAWSSNLQSTPDLHSVMMIQTRIPNHHVLSAASMGDPSVFLIPETQTRASLSLPPYSALATVSGKPAHSYIESMKAVIASFEMQGIGGEDIEISEIAKDKFLLRASSHEELLNALDHVGKRSKGLRVEIDPTNI